MYFRQAHTAVALSAQAAGTVTSADIADSRAIGAIVGINVTAISGTTPTLTVTIQGKDPHSGTYYTILTSAAINATGYTELVVYPGTTVAANVAAARPMPTIWRISAVVAGTGPSVTASISAQTVC